MNIVSAIGLCTIVVGILLVPFAGRPLASRVWIVGAVWCVGPLVLPAILGAFLGDIAATAVEYLVYVAALLSLFATALIPRWLKLTFVLTILLILTFTSIRDWLLPTASVASVEASPADSCQPVVVIGARGSGEKPGFGDVVGPIVDGVTAGVHADSIGVDQVPVTYPALAVVTTTGDWSLGKDLIMGSDGYLDGAKTGSKAVAARVALIRTYCGDRSRVVLIGYSQGALAVHEAVESLTPSDRSMIASIDLVADPARAAAEPSADGSRALKHPGIYTKVISKHSVPIEGSRSWCHKSDPICDAGNLLKANMSVHTHDYRDADFTKQVVQRILTDLGR